MKRPELHFTPPANWMNDPNGLIYFGGKYHIFYQHFPYEPIWGRMHWGHAVSDDLCHFEYLPIALYPSKDYDADGVFSGSAIEKDGKMYLYYTAIHYRGQNPENINLTLNGLDSSQAMIISDDGFTFDNLGGKKQVVPMILDKELGDSEHTRDPKVWKHGDKYYMVLGSLIRKEGEEEDVEKSSPELLFYESDDAVNWTYKNKVQGENFGYMWECPDVFDIKGNTVCVFSPQRVLDGPQTDLAMFGLVDFDNETCEMKLDTKDFRVVDYGLDYYAPQSFLDKKGRRTQIGWIRMKAPVTDDNGVKWIGAYTMPRVITVENGEIITRPHPEVKRHFRVYENFTDIADINKPYCIKKSMKAGEEILLTDYLLKKTENALVAVRDGVEYSAPCGESCEIELYVDSNIVETYIDDGKAVITHVL